MNQITLRKVPKTHKICSAIGRVILTEDKLGFLFSTPFVLPLGGEKYFAGLDQLEETITYTNRGLGMTNLPLRFGSRPEVTRCLPSIA